jgi:hypothetical protein
VRRTSIIIAISLGIFALVPAVRATGTPEPDRWDFAPEEIPLIVRTLPDSDLVLARLWIHERNFTTRTRPAEAEYAALGYAIVRRYRAYVEQRRVETIDGAIHRYSQGILLAPRNARTQWITELGRTDAQPSSWPRNMRWDRWDDRWLAALALAREFLDGQIACPCALVPDHWAAVTHQPMLDALAEGRFVDPGCPPAFGNRFARTPLR